MQSFVPRDAFALKILRELCNPKCARKVSGLSRNGPQISWWQKIGHIATAFSLRWVLSTPYKLGYGHYRNLMWNHPRKIKINEYTICLPFMSISQHIGTTATTNEMGPQSAISVMVVLSQPKTTCDVPCIGPQVFQIRLLREAQIENTIRIYHRLL